MRFKKFTPMQNRILGIDPGYGRLGIAILDNEKNNPKLVHSECFQTSEKLEHGDRLGLIAEKTREIIKKFKPARLAIETLIFSKNVKTALKVAEVRGVIMAEAANAGIETLEYHPNSIKIAITGYGKSDKKQIIFMIDKILQINKTGKKKIRYDDEYDAIAIALTATVNNYPHK